MDLPHIYKSIFSEIERARHVMLVAHQKPDGDTSGSTLAMAHYLDSIGKPYTAFCVDEIASHLRYLPKAHEVTQDTSHWTAPQFDLVIIFDASDLRYAGIEEYVEALTHDFTIINIDHHATNNMYGKVNLVRTDASSTCEVVHDLLDSVRALDKNMATCLMTGLITDTGSFSNLATTSSAIQAASKLLLKGVDYKQIQSSTMNSKSVTALRLWGRAFERLKIDPKTKIATTAILQTDLEELGLGDDAVEGISNFLNGLQGVRAVIVLSEREPGQVRGSCRTTDPYTDVSKLAMLLGGGGHKKAAGFSLPGTLTETPHGWAITK